MHSELPVIEPHNIPEFLAGTRVEEYLKIMYFNIVFPLSEYEGRVTGRYP